MRTDEPGLRAEAVHAVLAGVLDPEIGKPITELGMVKDIGIADGEVSVAVYLTVAGCPLKDTITGDIQAAVRTLPDVRAVRVEFDVMSDEQRTALRNRLRGNDRTIPFARPGSLTRVYCVASGKGGVGKSSVTVNLAAAMAQRGLSVGVLDADIHGYSIPRLLGIQDKPTKVEQMIMPPRAHGLKVISTGMFLPGDGPVVWRGPMLHRALQQFLTDVFWGDLDILLLDLPPGTGDIAISVAQLIPTAEIIVVTTPQQAAAEVAERAGAIAVQTRQPLAGVIENMSWLDGPDGQRMEIFGAGGGQTVADSLARVTGSPVPLLGQVPIEPLLREQGDAGVPVVITGPGLPAASALRAIAAKLAIRGRGLAGRPLTLHTGSPADDRRQS